MQETKLHALLALSFVNQSLFLQLNSSMKIKLTMDFLVMFQNFTLQFLKLVETLNVIKTAQNSK